MSADQGPTDLEMVQAWQTLRNFRCPNGTLPFTFLGDGRDCDRATEAASIATALSSFLRTDEGAAINPNIIAKGAGRDFIAAVA